MKRTLIILGTILGGIILIFGIVEGGRHMQWWGEPDELRAIKRESIVDGRLLGLELIRRNDNGKYNLLSKRLSPSVTLVFKTDNPSEDFNRVVRFAKDNGWVKDEDLTRDESWWGRKITDDGFSLAVSIDISTESTVTVTVL